MAAITWADVVAHDASLSTTTVQAQADILSYVNGLNAANFDGEDGPQTRLIRIYLAAHYALSDRTNSSGVAGPVTSVSAGGMSRSYASAPMADPALDTTGHGRLARGLIRLQANCRIAFVV